MKNIGLLLIATGKYDLFVSQLLDGASEFFLSGHNVTYFLFTDSEKDYKEKNLIKIKIPHKPWPYPTLDRYKNFSDHKDLLEKQDYLFYCDIDMRFVNIVGDEILSQSVSTIHPGHYGSRGAPETNPDSLAYVGPNENLIYFAGGFQGGEAKEFLRMSAELYKRIEIDKKNNIIAKWHDESHMNRWRIDNPPTKILDCGYCYQVSLGRLGIRPQVPRILALEKNKKNLRNTK
jgi:histo-blood group ABO system transferase